MYVRVIRGMSLNLEKAALTLALWAKLGLRMWYFMTKIYDPTSETMLDVKEGTSRLVPFDLQLDLVLFSLIDIEKSEFKVEVLMGAT